MDQLSTTPAQFIRVHVFRVQTQEEFANMLGYAQATISRFETGELPISAGAQKRIRALAQIHRVRWDNNYFFEVPRDVIGRSRRGAQFR